MNGLGLMTVVLMLALQNVTKKGYTQKNAGGVNTFSIMTCLSAALFFLVTSKGFAWNVRVLPYALAFAAAYCTTTVFGVLAIDCGSLSLTNLMISYSLMIPALYGVFFLEEALGIGFYPGMALLAVSLFLINETGEKATINVKWVIYVTLATVANGLCSVFQTVQQEKFKGAYKNEFMIVALVSGAIGLSVVAFLRERKEIVGSVKVGWKYAILTGLFNGIVNLLVMILKGEMNASLMFPLISAGGIIVTYLIARYMYKETLSRRQLVGFVLGVLSVILLNL